MKLNIKAYASAQTVVAAILYVICSFLVGFLPETAARLAGYIFHADLSGIMRSISMSGFVVGLLALSIGWGLLSLMMASVYNCLAKSAVPNQPQQTV